MFAYDLMLYVYFVHRHVQMVQQIGINRVALRKLSPLGQLSICPGGESSHRGVASVWTCGELC